MISGNALLHALQATAVIYCLRKACVLYSQQSKSKRRILMEFDGPEDLFRHLESEKKKSKNAARATRYRIIAHLFRGKDITLERDKTADVFISITMVDLMRYIWVCTDDNDPRQHECFQLVGELREKLVEAVCSNMQKEDMTMPPLSLMCELKPANLGEKD